MFDGRPGLGPLDARMEMNQNEIEALGVNRRDFLKSGSFATLMTMLGGVQLFGETNTPPAASDALEPRPPIKVALIGLGSWGREILNVLSKLPQADIAAISDTYGASLRRSAG